MVRYAIIARSEGYANVMSDPHGIVFSSLREAVTEIRSIRRTDAKYGWKTSYLIVKQAHLYRYFSQFNYDNLPVDYVDSFFSDSFVTVI